MGQLGFFTAFRLSGGSCLCKLALTGPNVQPSDGPKPLSFLLSSASRRADYFIVWIFPPWDLKKLQYTRVNILDLKILQVFFKNRGEILVFEKMLNFLSFLVLLYVSGHSKQKKIFKIFLTDRIISSPIHLVYWWWNFSISQKNFENFFFAWNVLKHKVKPKNSRNSTFFKKLKFPPYCWKTLVKFSSPKCSENFTSVFHK